MANKQYDIPEDDAMMVAEPVAEYAELMLKVDAGVMDIRQGKGISKKADETTEQFFERLCTE